MGRAVSSRVRRHEHGERLIENFVALTPAPREARPRARHELRTTAVPGGRAPLQPTGAVRVEHRVLDQARDAESAFAALFGEREDAFWLDSSLVSAQLSRFSFMGAAIGELGAAIRYEVGERRLTITRADGDVQQLDETLFAYLSRELVRLHTASPDLPFDLNGGFVGYLGYELKACGAADAHRAELPDGYLLLADRLVAFDHELGRTHLLALSDTRSGNDGAAERWLDDASALLAELEPLPPPAMDERAPAQFALLRERPHYMANVEACKRLLEAGESYEICLTNRIELPALDDAFELDRVLRRANPAPYGAFLRMREGAVLSSSPERFLRVRRDRSVEAKPIKGTAARQAEPPADTAARDGLLKSAKDRAEHLRSSTCCATTSAASRRSARSTCPSSWTSRAMPTCTRSSRRSAACCATTSTSPTCCARRSPAAR